MTLVSHEDVHVDMPVWTLRDVLLRMERTQDTMSSRQEAMAETMSCIRRDMDIQMSQGLDARIRGLESMQWKILGIAGAAGAIAGVVAYRLPL